MAPLPMIKPWLLSVSLQLSLYTASVCTLTLINSWTLSVSLQAQMLAYQNMFTPSSAHILVLAMASTNCANKTRMFVIFI